MIARSGDVASDRAGHRLRNPVPSHRLGERQIPHILRLWMSVLDWMKGIPIGYTYWVQYQAPAMLDEIAVHHDE